MYILLRKIRSAPKVLQFARNNIFTREKCIKFVGSFKKSLFEFPVVFLKVNY